MPPPESLSIFCPFCLKHTSLAPAKGQHDVDYDQRWMPAVASSDKGLAWIGICNYCARFVLVVQTSRHGPPDVFPTPQPSPTDERISDVAREALDEAKRCYSVKAYNACATMARRAIQAAANEKKAPQGTLIEQIEWLAAKGIITKDLADWAHEVRFVGNDAAHPPDMASAADAKDAMGLAEQFLTVVYVSPAIAEAMRQAREAAKAKK